MILIIYFLQGMTLALSATVMPGPFQAFLLSQALRHGWKRTLPAALAPLASDGPIIALVLFVLTRTPQGLLEALRVAGGLFIFYLAWGIFRNLHRSAPLQAPSEAAGRRTFLNAVLMNFLNPNPYIFWGAVAGPIFLIGWRASPAHGIAFVTGFYGTFICGLALLIVLFASAGNLGSRATKILGGIAGSALVIFGLYQISTGSAALLALLQGLK